MYQRDKGGVRGGWIVVWPEGISTGLERVSGLLEGMVLITRGDPTGAGEVPNTECGLSKTFT